MSIGLQKITESHANGVWEAVSFEQLMEEMGLSPLDEYEHRPKMQRQKKEPPYKRFLRCPEYFRTYDLRIAKQATLQRSLREFMEIKRADPRAQVSKDDGPFTAKDKYNDYIPGLRKCKITYDISLVYLIVGDQIQLYGFYTHDELGTTGRIRQQEIMAKKFQRFTFESARRLRNRLGMYFFME